MNKRPPVQATRIDDAFSALADEQCRRVLLHFDGSDSLVEPFEDLVDAVADGDGEPTDRDSAAIRLHHVTLPRLADVGAVEYERPYDAIRYRGDPILERHAGLLAERERPD